jgi:phosphoglycolate phosphatase-like HAD superfamily hydrolase
MSNAVVFDWDGTLVSCEEKIDLAIAKLCSKFSEIEEHYRTMIAERKPSPGWIRKGFVASLSEDYLTYRFGIIAELIAESEGMTTEDAWSAILSTFRDIYLEVRSRILADLEKLHELSQYMSLYVISNSESGNIKSEAKTLGIKKRTVAFIGNAKKYDVAVSEPSILGIPVKRPKYQRILDEIRGNHDGIMVVGDNFSLDLVTPIAMGIAVAHVPNPLTPKNVIRYVKKNRITQGTINDVLDTLIGKKGALS